MVFKFSEVGLGITLALILFSAIYTYIIRVLVISKNPEKISFSSIKISKEIFKSKNSEVFYSFKKNIFKPDLNVLNKKMSFDEKTYLKNSLYTLGIVTFSTYLYLNTSKKMFLIFFVQRIISFSIFMLMLFLFTFNLWMYALVFFSISVAFNAFAFASSYKIVKYSIDSTYEILKYHLKKEEYFQLIGIMKKFKFWNVDIFLNSGVEPVVEMAKVFKKWN